MFLQDRFTLKLCHTLHLLASGHPADADCAGATRPGHGEADGGGDGQEVRLRGRLLLGLHLVVAEDQAQDMVHLRRALLLLAGQGQLTKNLMLHVGCL